MDREAMRKRTKDFASRIVRLTAALPNNRIGDVLGRQILKSGTSVGANYREALRSSSQRQFISMIEISLREADETDYWLELINDAAIFEPEMLREIADECRQLIAILTATAKSANATKNNRRRKHI